MKEYRSFSGAKTRLRYHIILSTKYRRRCLNPIRGCVLNSFYKAASISHIKIHCIELDKDHIHLLLEFKPSLSIEQVVRRLKQLTTKYIWEENEEFLRNFYWKNKRILWSRGYFCSTIGEVSEKKIKEYIENQG